MVIDIRTLVMILGVTHLMQVVVFFHQFRINKIYRGIGWWLLWSAAEVIGFGVIFLRNIPSILPLVIIIQNLMIIGGTVFLYIGVKQFFAKKVNFKLIILLLSAFTAALCYFLFIDNDIQIRSIIFSALLAFISFITAYSLFADRPGNIKAASNFTAVVFMIHGGIFAYRTAMIAAGTSVEDFFTPNLFNLLPYLDALIVSLLWTFGLIIMLNQRLNMEMSDAKEELQLIFNTSPDAAMITRLHDGLIVDVNDGYTLITGYYREEMLGKSTAEINIWKNIEDREKIVSILKKQGYFENLEAVFVIKNDVEITGLMSAKVIKLQGVPHIISITRDITERKKTEEEIDKLLKASERSRKDILSILEDQMQVQEALRESERKFRETVFNLDEGYYSVTLDGLLLEHNHAFNAILGYDSSAVLTGMHMPDFWENPDDRKVYVEMLLREGSVVSYQMRALKKSGEKITVLISAHIVKNKENVPVRIEGVFLDISERRRAEEKLEENNSRLNLAMESAHMAWWEMDITSGNVVFNNRKAELLGYDPEKFKHYKDFMALVHPEDSEKAMNAMRKHIDGSVEKYEVEYRILTSSGEYKWFFDIGAIVKKDSHEKPLKVTGLVIDITDRKLAEKALDKKVKELEEFNDLMVGREIKMVELKREINELQIKLGGQAKYEITN